MDIAKFDSEILPKLNKCRELLKEVSTSIGDKKNTIILIETEGLYDEVLYGFQRILRKIPKSKGIDLIIESHGGSIDTASTIASLCRGRFGSFRVIAPFMAKSAATLIVLAADERLLTSAAQLGPVDPQVRHPDKRTWFPAHSIKEALDQVEATKDPYVKLAMADKLDPFLIGAYKDSINAATQYVEEIVSKWSVSNKSEIVSAFTEKYKSHGHPIDRKVLEELKVPFSPIDDEKENTVLNLHELCMDILNIEKEGSRLIMTENEYLFAIEDFRTVNTFSQ